MFSSIMQSVLTKFLGKYVDGIKNNIDINLTGNATIQKISLRPQFINSLGLPVLLKYSHISKILVNVPWASLKQKPTTITVQGLYVLLSLKYDDEDIEVEPAKKIKPIINRVKEEIKKKWEQKQANKTQTFAEKSIIRIIDNLIINIDEIHVRVESMKRNWDFSFGVVIDKISSFTVNQYGQKCFYTRHFTNKQQNPPLKKSFTCQRFEIYFNDEQDFFMCDRDKPEQIKALLMEPFQNKNLSVHNSPKKGIINKVLTQQFKQSYKMKILSKFSFDIMAEQKLSSDKKYIVEVKGQLPRVCFMISDIQLSQILVFLELIYEWVIDREKNGRRDFIFDQKTQIQYKKILLKLAKEEKTSPQEMEILYNIASETPLQKLENAADNLIKDYRIEKQMKKINKVANKQKSKQMIQKLFQRMENQNKEVMQLFEHIIIQLNIPQFRLSCMKGANALLEVGVTNIASDIKLVLSKHTLISVLISEPFVTLTHENHTKDLVILDKPQYSTQPFVSFSLSLLNKSPPNIKLSLKKRYIQLNQQILSNLVTWISLIRLKPPIINFLNEQLNYSIYITQQIFSALFSSANLALDLSIEVPILAIQLKSLLTYNFGTLKITRESQQEYWIQLVQRQTVTIDGEEILGVDAGLRVSLINIKPQTVKIDVAGFSFKNSSKIFKLASQVIKNPIVKQILKLDPIVQEETIFEGKFMLNEYVTPQNMLLKGNYLKFLPCGDDVYLLRTKMYPFQKKGKFGLIFRQEVEKVINIVLMDSQKTMSTLFETIRDYMLKICTISQWKKYYLKFPNQVLTSVSQVQTQQQNLSLIDLLVTMSSASIHVGRTESDTSLVSINNLKSTINYKQYNTDAKADVGCFGIVMGKQKIIQNLVIGVQYSYQDCMNLGINVHALRFNHIMHMSAQYSFMISNLIKTVKQVLPARPQPDYIEQKFPSSQDISYLLQSKINVKLSNCQAFIIGFRNSLKTSSLQLSKYRNTSMPVVSLKLRNIILMSSITLSSCQLQTNSNNTIHVVLDNLAIYLSLQLLLYELTVGRGSSFVNSIIGFVQRKKKQELQIKGIGVVEEEHVGLPAVNLEVRGFKTRFRFTQHQQVSTNTKYINLKICKNQSDRLLITIQATLNKLYLLINSNMILQPICATVTLHCNRQFLPLQINSYVEPILINISVHNLIQTAIVLKISLERIFSLEIVRAFIKEQLETVARNPRMETAIAKKHDIHMNFKVDSVKMILYSWQDFQLIRVKFQEINLDTKRGKENQVVCSIEHLNSLFRIYEPVLEETKIIMCIKDGPQAVISIPEIRLNVSQQFIRDIIHELFLAKQNLDRSLKQTKFNLHEQSVTGELQKYKSIITNMIIPEQLQQSIQEQEQIKAMQQKYTTNILKIRSKIKVQILAEVIFDNKKTKVQLKDDLDEKQIQFQVRSQYKQSYQMIQKYKQIIIKLSLLHPKFSTQCLYFTVSLFKTAYTYHTCKFFDEFGQQTESCVGIYVYQDTNSSQYILEIISPYRVLNTTTLALTLNWLKNQQSYQRGLKQKDQQWISPWVCDKVSINANNQHLFASSYPIVFAQQSGVYQISLNSAINNDAYNFCCLAVERELFDVEKWIMPAGQTKKKNYMCPATMVIKPAYFVINHFHSPVFINDTECIHKQRVPLYSMFRTKKNQHFFKIRLGDGSMHEVYLPKAGHSLSMQLKLKNDNYITISILRQKSQVNSHSQPVSNLSSSASLRRASSLTGSQINQHVYHIYSKLQLLVSLPKSDSLTLCTSILSTRYTLKKQLQLVDVQYQHTHPTIITGPQKPSVNLIRDKFNFYTYVHVLDQFQKYLEIKSNSTGWYSKEITLYPSYYGNDVGLYKNIPEDKQKKQAAQSKLIKKYLINYEFTKIGPQIIMYYVSILPKYYILNLSHEIFSVDGQGQLKHNERIVVDSDQAEIVYTENSVRWEMLNDKLEVNLSTKKEIIFFKQLLFKEYQINQQLKGRHGRKSSHSINVQQQKHRITIQSQNIKIFQILKHIGSYSATTFCIKQWNEWLNIHNNLSYPIIAVSRYTHQNIQISIATTIKPGQVGNHPYGIQNMPSIQFQLIYKDSIVDIGVYQTHLRFNDQIQLAIQEQIKQDKQEKQEKVLQQGHKGQKEKQKQRNEIKDEKKKQSKQVQKKTSKISQKIQTIAMYQIRKSHGRKVVFSLMGTVEKQQSAELNKKIKALIIPVFLRISQSLKVTVDNIIVSLIVSSQKNRKQLLRITANSLDFLLLAYPSGLYMLHLVLGLDIHAPQFPEPVLSAPNLQFYLEAVQQKFIQRMTLKVSKQITVFLTDKLIYQIANVGLKIVQQIKQQQKIFSTDPKMLIKQQENEGFYTSSLNSMMISQIHAKVTVKKMLIQNKENQKKIVDMGLSIAQLQDSGIKLPKIDIDQPVNANHINSITKKYVMQIIKGCLGGMNLIGNPKQFIQQIQAGTSRGMPVIGFIGGVFAGTTNSMSKIISTVSNSVSQLSMDVQYQKQRNQIYMNQQKGIANGIKQGSKSLFSSVKSGVVGLYKRPKQGLQQQGGIGLIKGTLSGIAGIFVKSATGVMDAASITVRGLKSASSYGSKDQQEHTYMQKPFYHKFKVIRPYNKTDQLSYNALIRAFQQQKLPIQNIDIIQSAIIQDEKTNAHTDELVIVTSDKLYVINSATNEIAFVIPNQKMNATGKFNQGVVLYYNQNQHLEQGRQHQQGYDHRQYGQQIVFRVASNVHSKERLYASLKAFVDLHTQTKDKDEIPE